MRIDIYERSPEGEALRAHRIRADLTQRMVGERMGFSDAMVALAESGRWRPNGHFIRAFSAALKLTLAEEQRLIKLRATDWKHEVIKKRSPRKPPNGPDTENRPHRTQPHFSDAA